MNVMINTTRQSQARGPRMRSTGSTAARQLGRIAGHLLPSSLTSSLPSSAATTSTGGLGFAADFDAALAPDEPIEAVRTSCAACAALATRVTIDDSAVEAFAAELVGQLPELRRYEDTEGEAAEDVPFHEPAHEWAALGWVPSTLEEELSAHATLHLLNIGHGYKAELRYHNLGQYKHGGYGSAYVTMLQGVGRAALSGDLTAERMRGWRLEDTAACFLVDPIPELADQLTTVFQETGAALVASGHTSLGGLVLATVSSQAPPPAHTPYPPQTSDRLLAITARGPSQSHRLCAHEGSHSDHSSIRRPRSLLRRSTSNPTTSSRARL